MNTKVYKLQSGVEVESELITVKKLKIFSKQGIKNNKTKMLLALIKKLGNNENPKLKDIQNMPANDVTDLLIQLRLDSFSPEVPLILEWKNEEKQEFQHEHVVEINKDFFKKEAPKKQVKSYELLEDRYSFELPFSKQLVSLKILTQGDLDKLGETLELQDVDLLTLLELRKPKLIVKDKGEDGKEVERLMPFNLDDLVGGDMAYMNKQVVENEGKINTSYSFQHPIKELSYLQKQSVDIVNSLGFLFPYL